MNRLTQQPRSVSGLLWPLVVSLVLVPRGYSQADNPSAAVEAAPAPAAALAPRVEAEPKVLTDYVESGGNDLVLTNGFGQWTGGYARGVVTLGNHILNGEVSGQREFGDAGIYFAAGDTYNFNSDWYGSLTVGSSAGGFFWPLYRGDAFLNRKLLNHKQFIATLGFSYYAAKDPHRDRSFYAGSTYYFQRPWILEEGIRFNVSNPGSVFSPAGFVAVTQGRNKHHYLTVRGGWGKEAYQRIGPVATLTDLQSQTFTITWRQWMGTNWGLNVVLDGYHNPFYTRGGTTFGFFRDF
jgi:YaiO family outer membrane protein